MKVIFNYASWNDFFLLRVFFSYSVNLSGDREREGDRERVWRVLLCRRGQVSSAVIGDSPETCWVLGLREPPETQLSGSRPALRFFFELGSSFSQIFHCTWGVVPCCRHGWPHRKFLSSPVLRRLEYLPPVNFPTTGVSLEFFWAIVFSSLLDG